MPTAEITNTTTLIAPAMHDGELRILDTDLATRLRFAKPTKIRDLIKRHIGSLEKMGTVPTVGTVIRGQNATEHYLNKKQAIFITAKSETAEATEITIEIIEKFDAYEQSKVHQPAIKAPTNMREALMLALDQQEEIERQKALIDAAAPKVAALDRICTADGSYGLTEAAKILQVKPKALIAFMATSQWIYRRNNAKNWLAYQAKIDAGYLWHKIATYTDPNGEEKTRDTVKVLPKGLTKLAEIVPGAKVTMDLTQMEARPFVKKPEAVS
ncbi:phage antirepressor KilAC domain-containing protein [Gluconobacter japonicus]|uniref:phage antirepressor KilAC domain-containing protein n=1 Tax=Gluconobacter japonicus TaxID=376620 RepID=UPI003D284D91